ncbi:hypothetical protein F0L68_08130 [Solihabitans fulvus]|uniref:Beta-ketoacyl synthase, N-terminal domain n=1 Tax=Solihabitans fulvus TaxID=1892852 RepID=A0A5B2XK07_9PSEU|nr:hypothetical protein [Solihabitans fulvus]KAA2264198.1 hypothetical protein F0L68_08130 [Solihabitans fulvus]
MTGLALRGASAVRAPQGSGYRADPAALDFLRDLVEPFGEKVNEDLLASGAGVSHRDLTDRLTEDEVVLGSAPQLVIVAHALPDVLPFTAVAPYLSKRLGATATSFAVASQGLAAPFTALRIAAAFHRAGRCGEAVIAVLEQTTLATPFSLGGDTPLVDSGVALVFGAGDGPSVTAVTAGSSVGAAVGAHANDQDTLVVLGPWADRAELPDGPAVHQVAPGSYCTSVWLALAEHWSAWRQRHRRILLCDTDPRTGRSHVAMFGTAGG